MTEPTGTPGPLDEGASAAGDDAYEEPAPVRFPSVRGHGTPPEGVGDGLDGAAADAGTGAVPTAEPAPSTGETAIPAERASDGDARGWWARLPWWAWAVVGLVVVAVVVVVVLATRGGSSPSGTVTAPEVTVTAPAPTPTATPLDHAEGSDLFTGLPDASGQFVLTSASESTGWVDDGDAIESYDLTYTGPSTASATSEKPVTVAYRVVVGQWKKAEDATAFATSLTAAAPADPTSTVTTGDVTVDGKTVGTSTITVPPGTGTDGTAVWTNGTVVVQVTGPGADLQRFFDGFGW